MDDMYACLLTKEMAIQNYGKVGKFETKTESYVDLICAKNISYNTNPNDANINLDELL